MPFDRSKYPADWEQIRAAVLTRAGNRCEGSPAYPNCRARNGEPHPVTGSRVVLTTAHLNHEPACADLDQLKALCQRCHLTLDAPLHAQNAARTRARRLASEQRNLFEEERR